MLNALLTENSKVRLTSTDVLATLVTLLHAQLVKARIKTIIVEEPIKLAQYIRTKHQEYQPHIIK